MEAIINPPFVKPTYLLMLAESCMSLSLCSRLNPTQFPVGNWVGEHLVLRLPSALVIYTRTEKGMEEYAGPVDNIRLSFILYAQSPASYFYFTPLVTMNWIVIFESQIFLTGLL